MPFATVDRVAQLQRLHQEVVRCDDLRRHFLDRAGAPVPARARKFDRRGGIFLHADEIVVGQPNTFAANNGRDVILAIFANRETGTAGAAVDIQRDLAVVDNQYAGRQGVGRLDIDVYTGFGDHADVPAGITHFRFAPGPFGEVISGGQSIDVRQVNDVDAVARTADIGGGYVVFQRFAHREKSKLEAIVDVGHRYALPVVVAEPGVDIGIVGRKSLHGCADPNRAAGANTVVAGCDRNALRRQYAGKGPAHPEMPDAVGVVPGAGYRQQQQRAGTNAGDAPGEREFLLRNRCFRRVLAGDAQGILREQVTHRIAFVIQAGVGFNAPVKRRCALLEMLRGIGEDAFFWQGNKSNKQADQRAQQQQAGRYHQVTRKTGANGKRDSRQRDDNRRGRHGGNATVRRKPREPVAKLAEILLDALGRCHDGLPVLMLSCTLANADSAIRNTASSIRSHGHNVRGSASIWVPVLAAPGSTL